MTHETVFRSGMHEIPPFRGEHFWMVAVAYHVLPELVSMAGPSSLDHENIVSVTGIFCCYCDRPLIEYLIKEPCNGQ
jgi:hypothetical protein